MDMNIRITLFIGFIFLISTRLVIAQEPNNNLPRYGNVKKNQKYIDADNKFIDEVIKQFGSRREAAKNSVGYGWDYFQRGDITNAMKRFNQAWLLDSTLNDTYWGFGAIMGQRKQFDQSIIFLKRYYDSNPDNEKIMTDLSTSYLDYAVILKGIGLIREWADCTNEGKLLLMKTLAINNKNAKAYSLLALTYLNENKLDSSKYYGRIANKLDPKVLSPSNRKALGIE